MGCMNDDLDTASRPGKFTRVPFFPHGALKYHFTSLKTNLIFLQQGILE